MTMIGKSWPVRTVALRLSSANRRRSPDTSLAGTECFDIFSPAPGDRDVISQVLRDSSSETKIAPSSVRIAACAARGASSGIVASRWVGQQPHSQRATVASQTPMGSIGALQPMTASDGPNDAVVWKAAFTPGPKVGKARHEQALSTEQKDDFERITPSTTAGEDGAVPV